MDYHWLITATLVTSSVIAVTANLFLLLVFCRRRSLRTVPNRFVINLLITNLLSSILLIPLLITDQQQQNQASEINGTNIIEREVLIEAPKLLISEQIQIITTENVPSAAPTGPTIMCYVAQSSTSFVCTASIFSILLIGINQYFGVIHSLRYHFYINKCKSSIFIAAAWLISIVCSGFGAFSSCSVWSFCSDGRKTTFNTAYSITYFVLVILAPLVAICAIYVRIYNAAHKNSERMRKSTSSSANLDAVDAPKLPKVQSAPNFVHLIRDDCQIKRTKSDRPKFMTNLRHKISSAGVFRQREETRAAKISILVIFFVLVCYIPYGVNLILSCEFWQIQANPTFSYCGLILLVVSNTISPFLFGYRNKRVKREILRMFAAQPANQIAFVERGRRGLVRQRSLDDLPLAQPFLAVPEVIVTPTNPERKSILKKYTNSWVVYKKCNFIQVPVCLGEQRGSFSSASTQISSEE